jgi:glycosyltransferase involved in cell wall biosynthesis
MPISILEALASGVPVVSTNVGGIPYLVKQGETALQVSPGDDEGMAAAVISLLKDRGLAEDLSREGLNEIQQYTWPKVKEKLLEMYHSVLRKAAANIGEQDAT